MIYFTSDWHLGDDRLGLTEDKPNVFFRPFKSIEEQNETIIKNINDIVGYNDTLIHLGDVCFNSEYLYLLDEINCKNKILILGNYDNDKEILLKKYFNEIYTDKVFIFNNKKYYLNHYPLECKNKLPLLKDINYSICGHIHGAWKFANKNIINVGVDAWNFRPISINEIEFLINGIENFYDENVFLEN